jgi:hypothetical protein
VNLSKIAKIHYKALVDTTNDTPKTDTTQMIINNQPVNKDGKNIEGIKPNK